MLFDKEIGVIEFGSLKKFNENNKKNSKEKDRR